MKNRYIFRSLVYFIFILMLSTVGSASVSHAVSINELSISETKPVNLTWVANQVNDKSIISVDNRICYLNASIRLYNNAQMYINNTEIDELRISNEYSDVGLYTGIYFIENVSVVSWNYEENRPATNNEKQVGISVYKGILRNAKFTGLKWIAAKDVSTDIFNITITDSYKGIVLTDSNNIDIYDIKTSNTKQSALDMYGVSNINVYDISIKNAGDYLNPATNQFGIAFQDASHNSSVRNVNIDGTGWSSILVSGNSQFIDLNDIFIKNSGHNGLDLHWCNNITVQNIEVQESVSNNIIITYSQEDYDTHDIYLKNVKSYNAAPDIGVKMGSVRNVIVENLYSEGDGSALSVIDSLNVTAINCTPADNTVGMVLTRFSDYGIESTNTKIIDSDFSNQKIVDISNLASSESKFVNVNYNTIDAPNTHYSEAYVYYYLSILASSDIENINDYSLSVSNGEGLSTGSVNAWGEYDNLFSSNFNEKSITENRATSPALASYYTNSNDGMKYYSHDITILDKEGRIKMILEDITPDSTWYRENPNIPTYTITAIIPDESSTEPQITGFAPSSDNPFTAGESKKFQVWADEELTTMKWYVNGNLVSSGSMDYTWKVESGSTTIMFSGFNSNGAVVQTWEITEGEIVEEEPVSSGTGLSFTPTESSLTATTGESITFSVETTQEFTSAVWSVDGTEVETGTTGHVEAWTTAGTHTVTFDGTAAAGTISRSWTVVVSAAAESEYSSISISPSATTVAPGESFSLDVYIDPTQALTGSQFDLQYSQLASISTVDEGDLFTASELATTFQYDSIDNAAGLLDNVYTAIVGSGTISSPGVMATIEMVAGSSSGILDLGLSDVILSDANSNPAGHTVSNATVLIDTAPQFTSVSAQTVEEKQSLSFTVTASDADGDDLSYSSTSLPSGATFNDGSFSWTPSQGDAGSYVATFEVTDGYLTDTVSVSITVTPLNNLPEITLFEPANGSTFEEGSIIGVNVAATDADGDSLSYIIEIDSVKVSTATSYTWTTDYESAGTHTIKVTVSDGTDEVSSSGTITITDVQPRWDVNEDGTVNVLDITLVGQNYGQTYTENLPRWDVNQDGTVNIQDLSIVSGHFGETI